MLENQITPPPIDMVMPPANTVIAVVCYVLLGAFMLWTLVESNRTRSPVPFLIMLGGLVTSFQEPFLAHVGSFWYPEIGSPTVMRFFNVSIPPWAIAAYGLYVGGLTVLVHRKMSTGITAKQLWTMYFMIWGFNLGLELPGLNLDIYRYYGDPPFNILGFPMTWAMTNVAIPMFASAVLIAYKDFLSGLRSLLIIPLMLMMGVAAEAATGLPTWLAMNGGAGAGAKFAAACITLSFSLLITHMISLKFCKSNNQRRTT